MQYDVIEASRRRRFVLAPVCHRESPMPSSASARSRFRPPSTCPRPRTTPATLLVTSSATSSPRSAFSALSTKPSPLSGTRRRPSIRQHSAPALQKQVQEVLLPVSERGPSPARRAADQSVVAQEHGLAAEHGERQLRRQQWPPVPVSHRHRPGFTPDGFPSLAQLGKCGPAAGSRHGM